MVEDGFSSLLSDGNPSLILSVCISDMKRLWWSFADWKVFFEFSICFNELKVGYNFVDLFDWLWWYSSWACMIQFNKFIKPVFEWTLNFLSWYRYSKL
jgi:hypothetical protein